jgi:hypothetical protein
MRPSSLAVRAIFVVATAISAAALADPVMEGISNAGAFGRHSYTDHSTLDVVPSLVVGLSCVALLVAILARRILVPRGRCFPWLRVPARALEDRVVLRLAPLIVAVQLGVLCAMETLEQVVVVGHPLGGSLWLGGPVLVSLCLHACTGVALAFGFAHLVRWSARAAAELIASVCRIVLARVRPALARLALDHVPVRRAFAPALDRRTGRAPPYPAS